MKTKEITDIKGTWSLANGVKMPYLGLGVWESKDGKEVIQAIKWALDAGYRHIDTAAIYKNEEGVGRALKETDVPRNDIFVTSKLWNDDQGLDTTLKAFDATMKKLDLETLDLYLIHWPVKNKFKDTWRAIEKLYADGRVKAIGVSNFLQPHLEELLKNAEVVPMVNQLEFHPWLVQQDLQDFCASKNIQYEAWSPLMHGKLFDKDIVKDLSKKYDKSPAQIVLRWDLQKEVITIPKSVNKEHIKSNAQIFDFEISEEDMKHIDGLDRNKRVGSDPNDF